MGSIQSSINSGINTIVLTGALCRINESIKQAGFKDIDHLELAINNLEIKIAEAEDEGKSVSKKRELLRKYIKIKNDYYKALKEAEQKKKEKTIVNTILIIISSIILITLFSLFVINIDYIVQFLDKLYN